MRCIFFYSFGFLFFTLNTFAQSDTKKIEYHVYMLQNTWEGDSASYGMERSAEYIFNSFSQNSAQVFRQKYLVGDKMYQNIICSFGDMRAPRIIIGSHYECSTQSKEDNSPAIAVLLELARTLNKIGSQLPYRIDLVAYAAPVSNFEDEKRGAQLHAKSLVDSKIKIIGMCELIALGNPNQFVRDIAFKDYERCYAVQKRGNNEFANKFAYALDAHKAGLNFKKNKALFPSKNIELGDHLAYWQKGYSALYLCNNNYLKNKSHTAFRFDELDYENLAQITNMLYATLRHYKIFKAYEY